MNEKKAKMREFNAGDTMKFEDFYKEFWQRTEFTKAESKEICSLIASMIMEYMQRQVNISIYGFGTLMVTQKQPRKVRGLFDNIIYDVPSQKSIRFKISNLFKKNLNETKEESV